MYNITTEQILKTKAPKQAAVFKTVMILACILAVNNDSVQLMHWEFCSHGTCGIYRMIII